jgi:outer membrane autotransporter protein
MERARGHRSIGVTASGNACRRRGWLMTLLLASVAIATVAAETPAMAQVSVDGDVTPNPWTPADALTVGNTGSGSLVIEGGATTTNGGASLAYEFGSSASVTVTGAGSSWNVTNNFTAGNRGGATVRILDGGLISTGGWMDINYTSAEDVLVTVSGVDSFGNASTLHVGEELSVGFYNRTSDGAATLLVEGGGFVRSGSGQIGYGGGNLSTAGSGRAVVFGTDGAGNVSTWENTSELAVGAGPYGIGALEIGGGGLVKSAGGMIGKGTDSIGHVTVSGSDGAGNRSTWENTADLAVGSEGTGTLEILAGGFVTSSLGTIGSSLDAEGTVVISGVDSNGTASEWQTGAMIIGSFGVGELTVSEGGIVRTAPMLALALGYNSDGDGTLNVGARSGDAAARAGIVDAGSIEFWSGKATLNFNHTDEIEFSSDLLSAGFGTHTLNHQAGITTLTGNSIGFTGATNVTGGTLIVGLNGVGSLGASDVTVGDGATLMGTGPVGKLTIETGGLHAPANFIGTQKVNGPYVLKAGATLEIEINATTSDVVVVDGTVDITGGILNVLAARDTYALNTDYVVIDNDGADAVVGTFAAVTSNYAFLAPTVVYDGGFDDNDVVLTVTRNSVGFEDVAETPNQSAVAGALEAGSGSALYGELMWLSADEARAAFDALSGEVHASVGTVLANDSRFVRGSILSRLQQPQGAPGSSGIPMTAYNAPTAVASKFDAPMMGLGMDSGRNHDRPLPSASPLVFWTQGFGSWGDFDGKGNGGSADRRVGGFLSGVDAVIGGDWRTGFAIGTSRSDLSVGARRSTAEIDGYHLALYAGGSVGALQLRGAATWSWNDIDTERTVVFPGFLDTVEASYDGDVGQIFSEIAMPLSAGKFAYEPFASLAYVHVSTDRFAEQGGIAALTGLGNSQDTGFATLGMRVAAHLGNVIPRASVAWQHAFGDVDPLTGLALATGEAFGISGGPLARNAALIEAGLDIVIADGATLGVSYDGEIASDVEDHGVSGRFNWRF